MKDHDRMSSPILFVAFAALACAVAVPCVARAEDDNLPAAVNRVERETGGRVLSAERRNQSGREVNRIKVYTPEGRVRVMWDQPRGNNEPPVRETSAREHALPQSHEIQMPERVRERAERPRERY